MFGAHPLAWSIISYYNSKMSTTILSSIVSILAVVLPLLGIDVGSEQLTTTIQTILIVGSGLWVWKERVARGDVSVLGARQ